MGKRERFRAAVLGEGGVLRRCRARRLGVSDRIYLLVSEQRSKTYRDALRARSAWTSLSDVASDRQSCPRTVSARLLDQPARAPSSDAAPRATAFPQRGEIHCA